MNLRKLLATLIIVIATSNSFSQTQNFLERPYLETRATYTTEIKPDRILLNIQIDEKDTKGKTSIEALENRMIVALKLLKIDIKKQLTVIDLSSDFKKRLLKKTDILKSKNYRLLVYDAKAFAQVVHKLEQNNISNITIHKTEYSKLEELKIELREKAVLKAKKQGESLLKPLDQKLGKALYISDSNNIMSRNIVGSNNISYLRKQNAFVDFADLDINDIKVQVGVVVYFEIQ